MNLAVFAYNFPHKKTQDFLMRLILEDIQPTLVIAANAVKLNIPAPSIRTKAKHVDLIHPSLICTRFGINYIVADHNSEFTANLLLEHGISIGLIAGSRILKENTINSVSKGIINIHPGLLPDSRGLDALLWAIIENKPLGVTSHVINKKIDHGYILHREKIVEYTDDTLLDLSLRLEEVQNNIVVNAIRQLESTRDLSMLEAIPDISVLHKKMPSDIEAQVSKKLYERLQQLKQ